MNFGEAIESLKEGKKLTRMGWNATGMWIVLMPSLYLPGKRRKASRFSHGDIRRNLVPLYRDSEIKFIGQLLLT